MSSLEFLGLRKSYMSTLTINGLPKVKRWTSFSIINTTTFISSLVSLKTALWTFFSVREKSQTPFVTSCIEPCKPKTLGSLTQMYYFSCKEAGKLHQFLTIWSTKPVHWCTATNPLHLRRLEGSEKTFSQKQCKSLALFISLSNL